MMNARYVISNMLERTGANAAALARRRDSLTVLCYHRVIGADDPARSRTHPAMITSKQVFERQMDIITREFRPVTVDDAIAWLEGRAEIAPRAVLVTFDDGWADTYTNAFPVMKDLGMPGVVFLATGLVGTNDRQWADAAYEYIAARAGLDAASREVERLKSVPSSERSESLSRFRPSALSRFGNSPNLTWPQVEKMASHGFEFGSHTRTHLVLPNEPEEDIIKELRLSADDIAARLGRRPSAFVYPDGQYDKRTAELVQDAGYTVAFTTDEGLVTRGSARFASPRLCVHDGVSTAPNGAFSRAMFLTYLAGTIPRRYRRRPR